jgi:hypothetical protein
MTETPKFETKIINHRRTPVDLREGQGVLASIEPDGEITLVANDPRATYARYEQVVFEPDGEMSFKERAGWEEPELDSRWVIEVLNQSGAELETRVIAGRTLDLMRGIVQRIPLSITDKEVVFRSLTLRIELVWVPSPAFPNYWIRVPKLVEATEPRSQAELREIEEELAKIVTEPAPGEKKLALPQADDRPVGRMGPPVEIDPAAVRSSGGWRPSGL